MEKRSKKLCLLTLCGACLLGTFLVFTQTTNLGDAFQLTPSQATEQPYEMNFDSSNVPKSFEGEQVVKTNSQRSTYIVTRYSGASSETGYHVVLSDGGYLSNVSAISGSNTFKVKGQGKLLVKFGQESDDLYDDVEVTLSEESYKNIELPVEANYFKFEAVGQVKIIDLGVSYSCLTAPTKVMIKTTNHFDGQIEVEKTYEDPQIISSKLTFIPDEKDGLVVDKNIVYAYLKDKHVIVDFYYNTVDVWDGTSISGSLEGSGTEIDPYLIQSAADLAYFKEQVNTGSGAMFSDKFFLLTKSIDLSNTTNFIIGGTGATPSSYFAGVFDGGNNLIKNFTINNELACSGLFSKISGENACLKNLSLDGDVKCGGTSGAFVGNAEATLENLFNYCSVEKVTADATIGGVVGSLSGHANNCENYGSVTSHKAGHNLGGIAGITLTSGSLENPNFKACSNYGTVLGDGIISKNNAGNACEAGGIVGRLGNPAGQTSSEQFMVDCINDGYIRSCQGTGGITGTYEPVVSSLKNFGWANIINCENHGIISSLPYAKTTLAPCCGGMAGFVVMRQIVNCTNYGNILGLNTGGDTFVGGIIGYAHPIEEASTSVIRNCINYGTVAGFKRFGGIVGGQTGIIEYCTNEGLIQRTDKSICPNPDDLAPNVEFFTQCYWVGGIAGSTHYQNSVIDHCVNNGDMNCNDKTMAKNVYIGGILGHYGSGTNGTISNCVNNGNITGYGAVAGICGTTNSASTTATSLAIYITNCTNNGDIEGYEAVGGIMGYNNLSSKETTFTNVVNNGHVSGVTTFGDISGFILVK